MSLAEKHITPSTNRTLCKTNSHSHILYVSHPQMDWLHDLGAEGHECLKSPVGKAVPFRRHTEDSIFDDPKIANDPKYVDNAM